MMLEITVFVTRLMNPGAEHVVGIAMESGIEPTASSEDLMYFDCSGWNEEIEIQTRKDQQQLGILLNSQNVPVNLQEYPE